MKQSIVRRTSRKILAGSLPIGGDAPISVQSMTNTDPDDFAATLAQVKALEAAGCDLLRLSVPTLDHAALFKRLKAEGVEMPLSADIHFDYRIAVAAAEGGADKIRINPGNIGGREHIRAVVAACKRAGVPIRIGVNGGSLEKDLLEKHGAPTAEALAESAMRHVALLEREDFFDIAISVKASNVPTMMAANRLLAEMTDYPLHLGVTEAGGEWRGSVAGAVGIGGLLSEGIGDTIRVSLTADPLKEVKVGREILASLGLLRAPGLKIVSCPTCGRTKIDLIPLLSRLEEALEREGLTSLPLTVALMGCVVNGPGEAREADVGVAGGKGEALLFRKGVPIKKIGEGEIISVLVEEIKALK